MLFLLYVADIKNLFIILSITNNDLQVIIRKRLQSFIINEKPTERERELKKLRTQTSQPQARLRRILNLKYSKLVS